MDGEVIIVTAAQMLLLPCSPLPIQEHEMEGWTDGLKDGGFEAARHFLSSVKSNSIDSQ